MVRRIVIVAIAAVVIAGSCVALAQAHQPETSANGCRRHGTVHEVTILNDHISPQFTDGTLCDTVRITNQDATAREIAFGPHDEHVPYDGVSERALDQKQSFTITLSQAGQFQFHDHIHDTAFGYLNVVKY